MNEVLPPTGVPGMTSDNIIAHFCKSKIVRSVSCLTCERILKSYLPLLLPMPDLTSSELFQD